MLTIFSTCDWPSKMFTRNANVEKIKNFGLSEKNTYGSGTLTTPPPKI